MSRGEHIESGVVSLSVSCNAFSVEWLPVPSYGNHLVFGTGKYSDVGD